MFPCLRFGADLLIVPPTALFAVSLAFDGRYGNRVGCGSLATGILQGDDLACPTPEEVSTDGTGRAFLQIVQSRDRTQIASVMCSHKDEEMRALGLMRIEKASRRTDTYLAYDQDGDMWGRAERCS